MKVWITKYALGPTGLFEMNAEIVQGREVARRMFDDIVNIHIDEQDVTWSGVDVDVPPHEGNQYPSKKLEWVRRLGRPAARGEWAP